MALVWTGELEMWPKARATGLLCTTCGYLHLFYNNDLRLQEHHGRT